MEYEGYWCRGRRVLERDMRVFVPGYKKYWCQRVSVPGYEGIRSICGSTRVRDGVMSLLCRNPFYYVVTTYVSKVSVDGAPQYYHPPWKGCDGTEKKLVTLRS